MNTNTMYDILNEIVGISTDALDLAFGLNGFTEETAKNILYWQTGCRNFEQYFEEIGLDFE